MRKAFLAAVSLVTGLVTFYAAAAGPAAAEPARESRAAAYGLAASGLLEIAPTITTEAAFPPGGDNSISGNFGSPSPTLLTLPLGNLALAGAVGVVANAHQADDIVPESAIFPFDEGTSEPVTVGPVNTRALAKTTGLGLVFTAPEGSIDPIAVALQALPGLLTADAVTSEAVARCVDGQPVFDVGFQVAGLGGIVGGILDPVVQAALDLLLGLIGPDAILSDIISIAPGVVTPLADGVAIEGLVISIPLLDETIVISHSEVHMAADCTVITAPPPATTGPGGPTSGRLASTGSDTPFLAIGMGLTAVALVGGALVRRSRKTAVQ